MPDAAAQPFAGRRPRLGFLIHFAAFVVVIAGVKAASDIVLLVLVSVFVAVAIAPPIFGLQKRGVPFGVALGVVLAAVIGVVMAVAGLIGTSAQSFREQLPEYEDRMQEAIPRITEALAPYGIQLSDFSRSLRELVDPGQVMSMTAGFFAGFGGLVADSFLILIMVVFLLLEASTFPSKLEAAFGPRSQALNRFGTLATSVNHYLAIKTWVSLLTGGIAGVWCAVFGLDFAVLWGVLAFLLNYVPNIGSILAGLPPVLLALVQLGPGKALIILAGYAVINNVLGNVVEPRFMGQGLGLSTFAVVLSLVFWGWVLGPVGMLLSIPLTMAVKIAMESGPSTRWMAILLGSGAAAEQELALMREEAAAQAAQKQRATDGPPPVS